MDPMKPIAATESSFKMDTKARTCALRRQFCQDARHVGDVGSKFVAQADQSSHIVELLFGCELRVTFDAVL